MQLVPLIILALLATFKQCNKTHTSSPSPDTTLQRLCTEAKYGILTVTQLTTTDTFADALKKITNAEASDDKEHVVSFGKNWSGNVIKSDAFTGNINNGTIPSISNRFADIHIHTDESPPSSGDLYGFIDEAIIDSNYIRYIATPNGWLYALVLINKQYAINFNLKYPRRPGITVQNADGSITKYQPTFPQILIDEFDQIKGWGGASKELATSFLLAKYNTGIALLKKDDDGHFRRLITKETKDYNGNKIYTAYNCE